jgi:hypothetical protein
MNNYRLDKTYGKAQTFNEADDNRGYWLQKDASERIKAAWFLIASAYGFSLDHPPRIDKSKFTMRKHQS